MAVMRIFAKLDAGQSRTLTRLAAPKATCVLRVRSVDNATDRHNLCISMDKKNKNWLPWQRPFRDRKPNFRRTIYSHSSTNPENSAIIGQVDFEIISLTGIAKNIN